MQVHAGECMYRHANGVLRRLRLLRVSAAARRQEVRGASMGSAHGRNDDKSPRPDLVKSGSVGSYGRTISCECAISDRDSDRKLWPTLTPRRQRPPCAPTCFGDRCAPASRAAPSHDSVTVSDRRFKPSSPILIPPPSFLRRHACPTSWNVSSQHLPTATLSIRRSAGVEWPRCSWPRT